MYPGGRSEEQALLCWMLQIPFPAQAVPRAPRIHGDAKWGEVFWMLAKKRNPKNTGLAVQANKIPVPLAFSKLPSQRPLCPLPASSRKRDSHRHRKSILTLILHMEINSQKSTKLPMEELLLLGLNCPYEHLAAAS